MHNLFRKEASESKVKGFSNPVTIKGSLTVQIMLLGIFFISVGLIAFSILTEYTRRSVVSGFLRPDVGSISVASNASGDLGLEILNGEAVSAGQLLAKVGSSSLTVSGQSILELELEGIQAAQSLIDDRLVLTRTQFNPLEIQQRLALEQHDRDIVAARTLLITRQNQLGNATEQLARTQSLSEQGVVSQAAVDDAEQPLIMAQQAVEDAQGQIARLEAQTPLIEIEWQTRRIELEQSINVLERERRGLEAQIIQLSSQRETGIFAPSAGVVTYSAAQDGENVNAGTVLFQITPQTSELQSILLAPSSAIGFVEVGDTVQLRYSAFPFREHGVFPGKVLAIDETAQLPSAIRAPIQVNEPVYRITVEIEQAPLSKRNEVLNLAPGMTLEASIIIDQKPLLFWLLDPLL